jgi:SWI/SNF chromatin-remodeling complex subunit SWI1
MGAPGIFHNPSLEKQMAALNAANLAKMANRSAPGSAQSPVLAQSYFGGNSLLHQSNGNMTAPNLIPSPSDQHLQSSSHSDFSTHPTQQQGPGQNLSNFQQNMNIQPPNTMSIGTPTSAGPQNAFPDQNNRSTPVPNQQTAQMQHMQKRKQFIQTLGSLMLQRGQPLPQALTGVPIPPGIDPNASPWKNLEPSQTEVGAIRLAGKDFDLYRFFGIVFQNGGGVKVCIPSPYFSCHPFPSARGGVLFPRFTPVSALLRCFPAHMTFWSDMICSLTNHPSLFLGPSNWCMAQCLTTV